MSARGLLHNGDYLKLLTGQTISSIGSAMSSFVFTLLGFAITGSPVQAGLIGTAYALGATLAALPAGALADRWSRRRILIGYSFLGAVLFGSVAVAGWTRIIGRSVAIGPSAVRPAPERVADAAPVCGAASMKRSIGLRHCHPRASVRSASITLVSREASAGLGSL